MARIPRPAGAFAADGVGRARPRGSSPHLREPEPSGLTGQTATGARIWGGSVPTKPRYRCATDPDIAALPRSPVRTEARARAMQALWGETVRRWIDCGEEKCRSEWTQGANGKNWRVISTNGGPLSCLFQALARGQARSQLQENAFSPSKGEIGGGIAGSASRKRGRVARVAAAALSPPSGGESDFNVLGKPKALTKC